MSNQENIHANHRKRMKARFIEHGLYGFNDHEKLEMLLYFAIPRADTNPIGHELMNTFGSVSAVFDASIEDLCKVKGISEHTALLIKMIPQFARVYACDIDNSRKLINTPKKAVQFFSSLFIGSNREEVYAVFLDNSMRMIDYASISNGEVNKAPVSVRALVTKAISTNAACVIMAHNHPGGIAIPSGTDLNSTNSCRIALEMIGVRLIEHYIIAGDNYVGILGIRSDSDENDSFSHIDK